MHYNYAIEIGGSFTTIYARNQGFVLKEPTLIAVETNAEGYHVKATGTEAKNWYGKHLTKLKYSIQYQMALLKILNMHKCSFQHF